MNNDFILAQEITRKIQDRDTRKYKMFENQFFIIVDGVNTKQC